MNKIGIIITTFLRNELLEKSVKSVLNNWQNNWELIIVDQNKFKSEWKQGINLHHYQIPFDSGLNYSRDFGIRKAKELGCNYVIMSADSIIFDEYMTNINTLIKTMEATDYDIIGMDLNNRIEWEAKLNLIKGECFEFDFIDKTVPSYCVDYNNSNCSIDIWDCDICRNFFITKIDTFLDVPYDIQFKMGGHTDEFYRLKLAGKKVGWTDFCSGTYIGEKTEEFRKYRQINFKDGMMKLREKYSIKKWCEYVHLERIKNKK